MRSIPCDHSQCSSRLIILPSHNCCEVSVALLRLQETARPNDIDGTVRLLRDMLSLLSNPHHYNILELLRLEEFKPDARWIARCLDITTDEVNVVLSRLLRLGLLEMSRPTQWVDKSAGAATRLEFVTREIESLSSRLQERLGGSVKKEDLAKQDLATAGKRTKDSSRGKAKRRGQPVTHWQILSPNPERLMEFCNQLFSWKVNTENALGYRQVDTGSKRGISGGIWAAPSEEHAMVQLFVEVDDVMEYATRAAGLGATIIVPPQALPDGDEMAVIGDPDGLLIGLMKTRPDA
jgi:predicted enzyme related to lactoylglutathione lyase